MVVEMSENEEQYSAYTTYHTNMITTFALFSGFIFVAIVEILAQYPNVAQPHAQAALFVLNFGLDLFLYQLYDEDIILAHIIKVAPQVPQQLVKRKPIEGFMLATSWIVLAMIPPILFALWGLLFLACASATLSVLWILFASYMERPWRDWFKEHPWIRK
jgi:hypothetical protein